MTYMMMESLISSRRLVTGRVVHMTGGTIVIILLENSQVGVSMAKGITMYCSSRRVLAPIMSNGYIKVSIDLLANLEGQTLQRRQGNFSGLQYGSLRYHLHILDSLDILPGRETGVFGIQVRISVRLVERPG
jgi:hypothetical protein